jgi:hypothetical protein
LRCLLLSRRFRFTTTSRFGCRWCESSLDRATAGGDEDAAIIPPTLSRALSFFSSLAKLLHLPTTHTLRNCRNPIPISYPVTYPAIPAAASVRVNGEPRQVDPMFCTTDRDNWHSCLHCAAADVKPRQPICCQPIRQNQISEIALRGFGFLFQVQPWRRMRPERWRTRKGEQLLTAQELTTLRTRPVLTACCWRAPPASLRRWFASCSCSLLLFGEC